MSLPKPCRHALTLCAECHTWPEIESRLVAIGAARPDLAALIDQVRRTRPR